MAAGELADLLEVGSVQERCFELRLIDEPDVVEAVDDVNPDELPAPVENFAEACRRSSTLVDSFVEGMGTNGGDAERACLQDVYLAMSPAEAEAVVAAASNPMAEESAAALAALGDQVEGCRT